MPIPQEGYWATYDSVEHAHKVFECNWGTCTGRGSDTDTRCWDTANYSTCDTSQLQCSSGATGILCGACGPKFTYNKIDNACVKCTSLQHFGIIAVLVIVICFLVYYTALGFCPSLRDNPFMRSWAKLLLHVDIAKVKVRGSLANVKFYYRWHHQGSPYNHQPPTTNRQ